MGGGRVHAKKGEEGGDEKMVAIRQGRGWMGGGGGGGVSRGWV